MGLRHGPSDVDVRRFCAALERRDPSALKSISGGALPFVGMGGGFGGGSSGVWWGQGFLTGLMGPLLAGARANYQAKAGDLTQNSVMAACLGWIVDNFGQALPCIHTLGKDGKKEPSYQHGLLRALKKPNDYYPSRALWGATAIAYKITGNGYWLKLRYGSPNWQSTTGPVVGYRWLSPWMTRPITAHGPGPTHIYISHYNYKIGQDEYRIPKENIVHFRDCLNIKDERMGWQRTLAVVRQICATNQGATYTASILENMGIMPYLITGTDGNTLDSAEALTTIESIQSQTEDENRGRIASARLPVEVHKMGANPEEMALNVILDRPVSEICSLMRLDPLVIGMESDRGTYENKEQATTDAWRDCMIPLQSAMADDLNHQTGEDHGLGEDEEFGWDYANVRALQEGDDVKNGRIVQVWMSSLAFFNESRVALGLEPVDGGDRLMMVNNQIVDFDARQETEQQQLEAARQANEDQDEEIEPTGKLAKVA